MTARRLSWAAVRRCFAGLPGVAEGTSYGTPAFRVGKRFLARLREDGEDLVVHLDMDARETLLAAAPDVFHVTDHYAGHPAVLVRLRAVEAADLARVAELAWKLHASKRAVAKWEAERR
jgi:hypothetical protein